MIDYQFKSMGLSWPRKATPSSERKGRAFRATLSNTYSDLFVELRHVAADGNIVFEVGLREQDIRLDGRPRADAPRPSFPGIILHIENTMHGPLQFICDDCTTWEHNLRAIVMNMQALRAIERYGVSKRGQQYQGWKQLPGPMVTPKTISVEYAASLIARVGEFPSTAGILGNATAMKDAYRTAAKKLHPDAGGSESNWQLLQQAKAILDAHHGA